MYKLSEDRIVIVKSERDNFSERDNLSIVIKDEKKSIEIPANRWSSFMRQFDEINNAVKQLREKQYVKFFEHIGGGWYISVTTGFWCVSIRRFYKSDGEIRPSPDGIALRLREWTELQTVGSKMMLDHPALDAVLPCYFDDDHQNQLGYLQCSECSPFAE